MSEGAMEAEVTAWLSLLPGPFDIFYGPKRLTDRMFFASYGDVVALWSQLVRSVARSCQHLSTMVVARMCDAITTLTVMESADEGRGHVWSLRWRDGEVSSVITSALIEQFHVSGDGTELSPEQRLLDFHATLSSEGAVIQETGLRECAVWFVRSSDPCADSPYRYKVPSRDELTSWFNQVIDDKQQRHVWTQSLHSRGNGRYSLPAAVFDGMAQHRPLVPAQPWSLTDRLWADVMCEVWPAGHAIEIGKAAFHPQRVHDEGDVPHAPASISASSPRSTKSWRHEV